MPSRFDPNHGGCRGMILDRQEPFRITEPHLQKQLLGSA